ncbi:helix-turn-helix transcriptional regulator [Azospirillum picis]|uniref:AraC family transcriptional regulator n=1 Tax=Azospirillum picis TaxID=488438 RepID=A0ABU0MNQ0_9PROT|nr:AraC family transcriptional regulator [Azospirillum picis]MBP2301169.1 AraC family transcriptional regulator [Azospirillum picis]MDQ0534869.1 AraC family transcriptional regulator [Azospirillum picis]
MARAVVSNIDLDFIPTRDRPKVLVRSIAAGSVGIARVRCDSDGLGPFASPMIEDAFLISHHLSNFQSDVWVDGKPVPKPRHIAGLTSIHDFRRRIACTMHTAFDTMTFHLPRSTLDIVLPECRMERLEDLSIQPSRPVDDPAITALAAAMLPALTMPERISALLLDHLACALVTHLASTYGRLSTGRSGGTLAPWQERRVKDMISARLNGDIRLSDLAAECRLSVGHFVRAFRNTTDTTPHQWLLHRRVDHAKALMKDPGRTLADIALDCGFADQSHFTRTFSRIAGVTPRVWRHRNAVSCDGPAGDRGVGLAAGQFV